MASRLVAMADWHYTPNPNGRISQLVGSLRDLNCRSLDHDSCQLTQALDNAILDYSVPPLEEVYTESVPLPENGEPFDKDSTFRSLLDLQPTPIFSDRRLPQVYASASFLTFRSWSSAELEQI